MNAFVSETREGIGNMPPGLFFGDVNQPTECGNLEFLNSGFGDATQLCDQYSNIPVELLEKNNWLVWKFIPNDDPTKKPRKVPFNPRTETTASSTDSATWTSHEEAVAVLYSGGIFACRHCYRLAYESQREDPVDLMARRADKIRARLGWGAGILNPTGQKPKGMRWHTYDRLYSEYETFIQIALNGIAHKFGFFKRRSELICFAKK